jgi:diguanylate cyclase (GGDEF)-like protein
MGELIIKRYRNIFSNSFSLIVVFVINIFSSPVTADDNEVNTNALKMLDKLVSKEVKDYENQLPAFLDKTQSATDINTKIKYLHHISMFYLTSDEFELAELSLNKLSELSKKQDDKLMQAIAKLYLIVVKAKFRKDQIRTQLIDLKLSLSLQNERKFEVNYLLAYSFAIKTNADYAELERLSLESIQLANEPAFKEEYFIALWRLANNELNLSRRLSAIEKLIDFSIAEQLPLNRHILLYNFVNYLMESQGNVELAALFANAYLSLANELNNKSEMFFALERNASIYSMMGENQKALELIVKARKLSKGQNQYWIARVDYLQSLQHIILGEEKEAIKWFSKAQEYYQQTGVDSPQSMKRVNTYLAFMSGDIALGVIEAEKIRLNDIKRVALERDGSFYVIRELVDQEKVANLSAKQSNEYLKFSVIVLILLLAILLFVAKRQLDVSRSLRLSQKELESFARKDGLTQLNNRQYWEEGFSNEYALLNRNWKRISSLIMFDIDHFKKINDQYGHLAGDEILKEISNILKTTMRTTDLCGRYGGEEFVILLFDTKLEEAQQVATILKDKIAATDFPYKDAQIKMTISAGVCQFTRDFQTHTHWIDAVDDALYQAKNNGRNKVVSVSA